VRLYLDPIFSLAQVTLNCPTLPQVIKNIYYFFPQVCVVLADSAESVAESTGNPDLRNATFDFVAKVNLKVYCLIELCIYCLNRSEKRFKLCVNSIRKFKWVLLTTLQ
jgi:hypothetical protein